MVHHEIRNSGCQVMKLPRTLQKPSSGRPWVVCGFVGLRGNRGQALRKRINYVIIYIHCNRAYTTQYLSK
jgi:hypothetical protein